MRPYTILILSAPLLHFSTFAHAGPCDHAALLGAGERTFLTAGSSPMRIVSGDLNNDTDIDLVVAEWGVDQVSVHLGIGDGTFAPAVRYGIAEGVGNKPHGLAIADFNNDSFADIAVGNQGDSSVSILLGDGSGAFTSGGEFDAGFFVMPTDIAVSDLDSDGDTDMVVSSEGNSVRVMLNNGDATFAAPVFNLIFGSVPTLDIGLLNNDTIPDIAACGFTSNGVVVLLGQGDGSFSSAVPYDTGTFSSDVQIADMDNDGDNDLVVSGFFDTVSVHLNDGSGVFSPRTDYPVGVTPVEIRIADMDGDGYNDLMAATFSTNPQTIAFVPNDGTGALGAQHDFPSGNGAESLTIDDFNNDGAPDVAAVHDASNDLYVFLNTCIHFSCGCNPADLAEPCGVLNFFDVTAFLSAFNNQEPVADLAAPFGVFNFFDVSAFLTSFVNGCP